MTTGEKIAALRREHKLSQEALGEKLGLSRQAVSKWEADQAVPTMDNLMELSRLFGVPVDTLLRPDAPFPAPPAEKNSADAPAAPETPHKGVSPSHGKILAIGGAALLCVSLALNAVCLYQIAQLKGEVQALRVQAGNVNTVYYPGTDADTGDFAESSEHMTLDPENTEQLIVTFSAVPRVASDGETAKFLLRGGEQSWECEAEDDAGGGYRGSLTIPMVDEYSVYLVLTGADGSTSSGGGYTSIIMIVVLIAVFYFFMIRPENKKKKKAEEMRNSLSVGDKITTIGGMVGKVVDISGDLITFETGEDRVRVQVTKWAISTNSIQKEEQPAK